MAVLRTRGAPRSKTPQARKSARPRSGETFFDMLNPLKEAFFLYLPSRWLLAGAPLL
jgi:hypothetical protein